MYVLSRQTKLYVYVRVSVELGQSCEHRYWTGLGDTKTDACPTLVQVTI